MSESRIVASLAALYSFRMLGLFMVLPVLVLYGQHYEGANTFNLGLALGIYGLTQAIFQIPLGMLSDRIGRKPVIVFGLVLFALGSIIAAFADSVYWMIVGRALQGSGAIASTIMALVADLTSEENRTKAMASIGASIGVSFALALVLGPALASQGGLTAIFILSASLAVVGIAIVALLVPSVETSQRSSELKPVRSHLRQSLLHPALLRLNFGIFSLHCVLMASFVVVPFMIVEVLDLDQAAHWQVYLPVILISFLMMLPFIIVAEKKRRIRGVFQGFVGLLLLSLLLLSLFGQSHVGLVVSLLLFFLAFNALEATLPSIVSKIAPVASKGTALGVYSCSQFFGAFIGGVAGGWAYGIWGPEGVFFTAASLVFLWFIFALSMPRVPHFSRLSVPITEVIDREMIENLPGVREVLFVQDEGILYLKIEKPDFDRASLDRALGR